MLGAMWTHVARRQERILPSELTRYLKYLRQYQGPQCLTLTASPVATRSSLQVCRSLSGKANAGSSARRSIAWLPDDDKTLKHFLPNYKPRVRQSSRAPLAALSVEAAERSEVAAGLEGRGKKFHIETRGCQMNVADSEVVRALLVNAGYAEASVGDADIVLINTCAIRDKVRDFDTDVEASAHSRRLQLMSLLHIN